MFFHRPLSLLLGLTGSLASIEVGHAADQSAIYSLNTTNPAIHWTASAEKDVTADGAALTKAAFDTSSWLKMEVPGTVFGSCVDAGLEKDPNFGDNIYQVDKTKYERSFWYRTEFAVPDSFKGKTVWLHFSGINKSADIYLNGTKLGSLYGFMDRGDFDITKLIQPGTPNRLAALVTCPVSEHVANWSSPTYLSSSGWDWMPHVPGLLSGITDNVYLKATGPVTIADPWMRTHLESNALADLTLAVDVANHSASEQSGNLTVRIEPGNIQISKPITLTASQTSTVTLTPDDFAQLKIKDPKLWWPNGYGDPNLYSCEVSFVSGDSVSDAKKFNFGVREYSYDTDGDVLHIKINGRRIFVKGGNWGMSEYMLRCRGAEYDLKLRLHKDMNMDMIRNWLGSTTDEEFYDACDKYGVMVWDDFWLNSALGIPGNKDGLNNNAIEKIKRVRNHPCVAVWCGENEGVPAAPMDDWFRNDVQTYDGGDRHYQSNSHAGALTGSGVWANMDPAQYFTRYPLGFGGNPGWGFRTEIGTAVFTTFDSFKMFMPEDSWWPRNEMWNKHFFGKSASNGGPDRYVDAINKRYGTATGIEDFCRKAQLLNIETNKAMYEGWLDHMWNDASGIMTWMSQSAYPSLVWQTYDYYYDLNGAYWGVKKACEPIHIQWSAATNSVKVINTTSDDLSGLTASGTVYDMNGEPLPDMSFTKELDSPSNTATEAFAINFNPGNLAYKKTATASTTNKDGAADPNAVTDGGAASRWSSDYSDEQWIYVDLGQARDIGSVRFLWDTAYGKSYDIQVSDDAQSWTTVYTSSGKPGEDMVKLPATAHGRYVKMNGHQRGSQWGFSLFEFEVYAPGQGPSANLTGVHFIKLKLTDKAGHLLSDNFYWCGSSKLDYTDLNSLQKVKLQVDTTTAIKDGQCQVTSHITNPADSPAVAFAVHVQPVLAKDGKRILPVFMNDDYFTLFKGESKDVTMTFDASLLGKDEAKVLVEPYNSGE